MFDVSTETPAGPGAPRVHRAAMLIALPAMVVAVVVGILGMHVLSGAQAMSPMGAGGATTHASMSAETTVQPSSEPVRPASRARAALAAPATAGHSGFAIVSSWAEGGEEGHGMGSMMMLCVAMLLSAGATVLVLFVRGHRPKLWARLSSAASLQARTPPVDRVGTGPPTAWRFSVIRC